ncbi:hypothetical protein RQP46_002385 [Phenoliferia psychrophenolica]
MLRRLLSPPGFGRVWDALPTNATPKEKYLAHYEDVALVFDPVRIEEIKCLLYDSDALYYRGLASDTQIRYEEDARLSDDHYRAFPSQTLPFKWRTLSVTQREDHLVAAVSELGLFDGAPAESFHWFFAPELSLSAMCSGQGEGLVKLYLEYLIPRHKLVKEKDVDDVLFTIPNNNGSPMNARARRADTTQLLSDENFEDYYTRYLQELSLRNKDNPNPYLPASRKAIRDHFVAFTAMTFTGVDTTPTCVQCNKQESPSIKFLRCQPCRTISVKTLYCSVGSTPAAAVPERVDELEAITGPEERPPRANGSPFRTYDNAPEDVMLDRLLSPPGFGRAWDALPTNATPRQMFLAHFEDVALIFDPCILTLFSSGAKKMYAEPSLACNGTGVPELWSRMSVWNRERYLVAAASELHDGMTSQAFYWFFVPELSSSNLCSGEGEGFRKLCSEYIIPKGKLVKEEDIGDRFFPIPNKSGTPPETPLRSDANQLLNSEYIDSQYASYVEDLAFKHMNDANPPKPASREAWRKHLEAYAAVSQGMDMTPACSKCQKSEPPANKFMRCTGCKNISVKTLYCSV